MNEETDMKADLRCLVEVATKFRDAFHYDPGHSDLDNEQPIHISVTLGDWRKLDWALRSVESATAAPQMPAESGALNQSAAAAPLGFGKTVRYWALDLEAEAKDYQRAKEGECESCVNGKCTTGPKCEGTSNPPPEHEVTSRVDWEGDPGVINGTRSWEVQYCRVCGAEEDELDRPCIR